MYIKDIEIKRGNSNNSYSFLDINELPTNDLVVLLSTISSYYAILGSNKNNKEVTKTIMTDFHSKINIEINNESFSWEKKFNKSKNIFNELKFSHIKKFANKQVSLRQNFKEINNLSLFYYYNSEFDYQDKDYLENDKGYISLNETYNMNNKFLTHWIISQYIATQKKTKNVFHEKFLQFIKKFSFSFGKIEQFEYDYIEQQDQMKSYGIFSLPCITQQFYIVNINKEKIYLKQMKREESELLILIGEIIFRLYSLSILMNNEKTCEISNISGTLILNNKLCNDEFIQINKVFPKIQIFKTIN